MADFVIRGAALYDGEGNPPVVSSVAISDGKITAVGPEADLLSCDQVIDAAGKALSPGFIDIHTHADIALLARPEHLPKVMQGVTTEVFTNCGLGFAPVKNDALRLQKEYLSGLFGVDDGVNWDWFSVADLLSLYETRGIGANAAYLIPHGSVRVSVIGMEAMAADASEIQQMTDMIEEGMEQGAWGLSTGLWYSPMCFADQAENVAVCKAAGFFATHQRDYGDQIWEATRESIAIAREAGVPVQISHLQMNGPANFGKAGDLLAIMEEARSGGVDATCDTYPYTAGSTIMQTLLPAWATEGGPGAILDRLADEDTRQKLHEILASSGRDWSILALTGAVSNQNRPFEGMRFDAIAAALKIDVAEWVLRVLVEDELQACYISHAAHEGNVRDILQWPHQMIGSDGLHLPGKCHPRLYGTFPRVLGHYSRDEAVISLAEAIRKMTSLPADRLGMNDRGRIRKGCAADLVLFDPALVADTATFEDPLQFPAGISDVWVNGIPVKISGESTRLLPGQVLRKR